MFARLADMKIILCLSISIIAICNAQDLDSREFGKQQPTNSDKVEDKLQKQQENIEALMKQVGDMGMLLENYRRVIVNGITEANDICAFIDEISTPDEKSTDKQTDMGVNLYKQYFRDINDQTLKTQLFAILENHIDNCYNLDERQILTKQTEKRDKGQMQKIRFHSWGGKRNRGGQKIVIRTPFHSWGGKRSGEEMINNN
ncbi:hypothetical protein PVAND_008735 [Polypedilum vanderplanki]|uniref:Uncharacterized protein n=1 Tax=Polypedilum vanderplanki TaxID=319348 RepID=A0A9J6CB90_POLVA|nr:hypothetical protein PVAND_008735 [Polypedilum vanderplanki]